MGKNREGRGLCLERRKGIGERDNGVGDLCLQRNEPRVGGGPQLE